jgi:hypothetical protein
MSKVLGCIMGIICIMSLNKIQRLQDDSLYCISVDNVTGCIITSCIGIQCLDNPLKDTYMSIDELPDWVKGKIAVLNMVELIKDTNGQEYTEIVDGVGYRLGNTYYIGPLTR